MREIVESLASGLGIDATEFADSIIGEDGLKEGYQDQLKSVITNFKKNIYDTGKTEGLVEGKKQGKGWAEKEAKTQWESQFKEKLGVEVEGGIDEAISAYQAKILESREKLQPTENDILNSEIHQSAIKSVASERDEFKSKYESFVQQQEQQQRVNSIYNVVKETFEKKYNGTPKALERAIIDYTKMRQLAQSDDSFYPVDDSGNPIRSKQTSEAISLIDDIDSLMFKEYFPLKETTPNTPGGKGVAGVSGSGETIDVSGLKTDDDWSNAIKSETDPTRKRQLAILASQR